MTEDIIRRLLKPSKVLTCTPKRLRRDLWVEAARKAIAKEPRNAAPVDHLLRLHPSMDLTREHIALLADRKWPSSGVDLSVQFLDKPDFALRTLILSHMNAWQRTANVRFRETNEQGQVRIARLDDEKNGGYWSYLGTEIEEIELGQPTMNLEGFTADTSEEEFKRVVRHETGHTLGFPHEHMRKELVERIDRDKAIEYFMRTQGWSKEEVINQVLTPYNEADLIATLHADENSIMCYQIPDSLTKDGEPIVGGLDIDSKDYAFAGKIYPKHGTSTTEAADMEEQTGYVSKSGSASFSASGCRCGCEDGAIIEILANVTRITLKRPIEVRRTDEKDGDDRKVLRDETPARKRIVAKLIIIFREVGRPEPINEQSKAGDSATLITRKVNTEFFPTGGGFTDGEITENTTLGRIASAILNKLP